MDLIYIAYQKKIRTLRSHLEKVPGENDIELIHRLRLDIKRIRVIFHLLEILVPEKFKAESRYSHFRNLFKYAGLVREIQLEIKALDHYHASGDMLLPFKKHLLKEEKLARKKMIRAVKKTDIKRFREIEKKIRKVCNKISTREFLDKTFAYILSEAGKIRILLDSSEESGKMHKIRQYLKSVDNVIALIRPVFPGKKLELISRKIKVIDNLIGSYHDNFILMTALEIFIENLDKVESETFSSLKSFSQKMRNENEVLLKSLNPKINSTLTILLRNLTKLIPAQSFI